MADEPKKKDSDAPKAPPKSAPAEPVTQAAPQGQVMQAFTDTFSRAGGLAGTSTDPRARRSQERTDQLQDAFHKYGKWRLQQFPFDYQVKPEASWGGRDTGPELRPPTKAEAQAAATEFAVGGGGAGGGIGGMVKPLQAFKAVRQAPAFSWDPGRLQRHAKQIFQNRKQLKEDWKDVGGPGPTDVTYMDRGADMTAMKVVPKTKGDPVEVLKIAHDPEDAVSRFNPEAMNAEFVLPSKVGVRKNTFWVVQPEIQKTKNVLKKTPEELGFDPRASTREMLEQERRSPYTFFDDADFNFGFLGPKAMVLDVGSVDKKFGQALRTPVAQRPPVSEERVDALLKPSTNMTSPPASPIHTSPVPLTQSQVADWLKSLPPPGENLAQTLQRLQGQQGGGAPINAQWRPIQPPSGPNAVELFERSTPSWRRNLREGANKSPSKPPWGGEER